jgi:hypothetical protein
VRVRHDRAALLLGALALPVVSFLPGGAVAAGWLAPWQGVLAGALATGGLVLWLFRSGRLRRYRALAQARAAADGEIRP